MRRSLRSGHFVLAITMMSVVGATRAADVPVTGLKLIVIDKTVASGKAKAVFIAKDAGVTKGVGTDPTQISTTLDIAFDDANGTFHMDPGGNWRVNSATVAKYVSTSAPIGGGTKVGVVKPASLVKVVGKSLGDIPLDISIAPTGTVYAAVTIVNGAETTRLCTQFAGCEQRSIAGGTGYKLVCKEGSTGDSSCTADCVSRTGDLCVLLNGTIYDEATRLQWEPKTTAVGSGVNAADPHDVDNGYRWAGSCSVNTSKLCQPNDDAEAACKAQTDAGVWANGCEQCVGGDGTCVVAPPGITTVWDWVSQLNAAHYAGHTDWRLPSQAGCDSCYTGPPTHSCTTCAPHELETILLGTYPTCPSSPCISPVFGATQSNGYWSSATRGTNPNDVWGIDFTNAYVNLAYTKSLLFYVRAVRGGS